MSVITNNLLLGEDGYNISRSVRLRSSASAYFNRTLTTATSQQTFTFSCWLKRGKISSAQTVIGASGAAFDGIYFNSSDQLLWYVNNSPSITTTAVFRDPSAWYHLVLKCSGASSVLYVNNASVGTGSTAAVYFNTAISHIIGQNNSTNYLDGYLTEINFVDGQALTPSSFGETDLITGVWKPKKYAGTYGTNGFFLNFSDNSSNTSTTIGKDYSGNGNNWTPNNISVTSGVTYDSMLDTPTPYADGGNGRGNYATLNPLPTVGSTSHPTFSDANLKAAFASYGYAGPLSTLAIPSQNTYCEFTCVAVGSGGNSGVGIAQSNADLSGASVLPTLCVTYGANGYKVVSGSSSAYGSSYTTNDVIGIAYDQSTNQVTFYKNNVSQGALSLSTLSGDLFFCCHATSGAITWTANFGQRPFSYTPPTGFKALNTQNLPDATIKKGGSYFNAVTYTGNGATGQTISGAGFQPDLVWVKSRSAATDNGLQDAVRGATKDLNSNNTDAEETRASSITAFTSDGFTLGGNDGVYNTSAATYVAWQWKESVSAGFDIVTFTNPSSGSSSFSHSLGVKPSMIIVKARSNTSNWTCTHKSLGTNMADKWINLESTAAVQTSSNIWGGEPTSSVFYCGTGIQVASATMVAYLFAEVAGFSKFGSYTGNGSTDGPFVYCGFRPKFILYKNTSTLAEWVLLDTSRDVDNVADTYLFANSSGAEATFTLIDFLSNGFKLRTSNGTSNGSGNTFIFAAFAENPFKNSLAR